MFFFTPEFLVPALTAAAVFATIVFFVFPMLQRDPLGPRMKSVALERDQLRARERARLNAEDQKASLRGKNQEAGGLVKTIVERFNLRNALADDGTTAQLTHAGLRGQKPLFIFLAARFTLPAVTAALGAFYVFFVVPGEYSTMTNVMIVLGAAFFGFYLPILVVKNLATKRQQSITRAWPDALDLGLICVESGMSIEASFRRVSEEIGKQSIPLAEELVLTVAELSYLQDRRTAYENLAVRTGLENIKAVTLTLIQAERYGTPLGQALKVLSQENRDKRMSEAEKKAHALPPKLTVPMILFFLPVLFAVVMTPAIVQVIAQWPD